MLAPAKTVEQMSQIIFNDRVDAALTVLFMGVVVIVMLAFAARVARKALANPSVTAIEGAAETKAHA